MAVLRRWDWGQENKHVCKPLYGDLPGVLLRTEVLHIYQIFESDLNDKFKSIDLSIKKSIWKKINSTISPIIYDVNDKTDREKL